jgi:hypothetical protein
VPPASRPTTKSRHSWFNSLPIADYGD